MGHVVRQQFTNPITNETEIRDLEIALTMLRPNEVNVPEPQYYLSITQAHHVRGVKPFPPLFYAMGDQIQFLLDATPNSPTPDCHRTRLVKPYDGLRWELRDVGPNGLDARVGDPVAFLSDLGDEPEYVQYGIIQAIKDNSIQVHSGTPHLPFVAGAFVQNLANRWHREHNLVGPKAQLTRPAQPTFAVRGNGSDISIILTKPLSEGIMTFIDCYVRTKPFKEISPHWIPDIEDANAKIIKHPIETYNGGKAANGGLISERGAGTKLFLGLVGKAEQGDNTNRSAVSLVEYAITPA